MATHYYTRSRRYAYDQEDGAAELREMLNDPDVDLGDLIAACVLHGPESKQEETYDAVRSLSEDARGPRSWARDRLERRQLSRDARAKRARDKRLGKDLGPNELTESGRSGRIEGFGRSEADRDINEAAGDRRRFFGSDMALDGRRSATDVMRFIQGD
jgi:hypothetical protein